MLSFMDIQRGKFSNAPLSYTQRDSRYSPAFVGTPEEYIEQMEANKSLFDSEKAEVYNINFNNNPANDIVNLDFKAQQDKWAALYNSLYKTRNESKAPQTRLIGLDFETLRVDVAHPYKIDKFAAVTELGIAETIIGKNKISSKSTQYSIVGGINEEQLVQYLKDYLNFKKSGLNSFDYSERKMIKSTMERFSRYGQGNIDNIFGKAHIKNLGDVTVLNTLGDSKTFDERFIIRGIAHLSVLGGISEKSFINAIETANAAVGAPKEFALTINDGVYAGMQQRFANAGLKAQLLNKDSDIAGRIVKFFDKTLSKNNPNTFGIGYNTNVFDLNIYKNFIGDNLDKTKILDIFTGIRKVLGTTISQEKVAEALGVTFENVAHNAGSDARVTAEIIASSNFLDNKSLPKLVSEIKPYKVNELNQSKKIYYALDSIGFNKQGSDYLNDSRYVTSGIQRGRYYYIDEIKKYEDGRFGVKFISANKDTDNVFIKVFDTAEEMAETIENTFLAENENNLTQALVKQNDFITNADKTRRNYEDLFSTRSITYNVNNSKYEGGYEKLNQYYKAYKISASKLGNIDDTVIQKIAETSEYDEVITGSLNDAFNISGEGKISKSTLRDFKAGFGRIHDESEMLGYIIEQLDNTGLNTYQKTLAMKDIREKFIEDIEKHKFDGDNTFKYSLDGPYTPSRRDMFSMDINMSGKTTSINFENKGNAINKLVKNFYSNAGKDATNIQVAESMVGAVDALYKNGLVDFDFLKNFYQTAGVRVGETEKFIRKTLEDQQLLEEAEKISKARVKTISEIQPRKLAEMIATKIQDTYVVPILNTGFNYQHFANQDFSNFDKHTKKDLFLNFFKNKTERITGSDVLAKARGNRYAVSSILKIGDGTENGLSKTESLGGIFGKLLKVYNEGISNITNKAITNASNVNISLNKAEIMRVVKEDLGYSDESTEEFGRILFSNYKNGDPYGLTTYGDGKRTKFITQFAYSGVKGEDAFVLVNLNNDRSTNIAKTMEIMGDDSLSFIDKINKIKEEGYAGVLQLKGIQKQGIKIDTNDPFFDSDYSYNTITIGSGGYKKVSQKKLAFWDHGAEGLENLEITLSDDANILSTNYRKIRESLLNVMDSGTLSETEKYSKITSMFSRANNNILTDMPGPSGYQTLSIDGTYKKILVPTIADILQSSQLQIQPLEILALETAKMDVLKKGKTAVADVMLDLAGKSKDNREKSLNELIAVAKKGGTISEEFNEYFLKHLVGIPMGLEENFSIKGVPEENFTFIDYFYDRMVNKDYTYHKKTKGLINYLASNKDRLSQFLKEKATHDKKISTIQNLAFNQYAFFDSNIRPPANQQQGGRHFLIDEMKASFDNMKDTLGKNIVNKLQLQIGYDVTPLQRAELIESLKDYNIGSNIKYGQLEDAVTANYRQMDSAEIIAKYKNIEADFDNIFKTVYSDAATKFGISEQESKRLLQQAFDVMKNRSANVYESRGIGRASFVSNDFFTAPEVKTVELNPIDESQLKTIKASKQYQKILKTGFIEHGTKFMLPDDIEPRTYTGPSGLIEDLDTFLTTGKGHLIEATKDPITGKIGIYQGTNSIKFFLGNEKGTLFSPEFNSKTGKTFIELFKDNETAKNAYIYYLDSVFDKIFGEDVSAVFDLPILKHRTNSITYGSYLNRIFYNVNEYIQNTGDEKIFTELDNIFQKADPKGININRYKGKSTIDITQLGNHGAFIQVEKVLEEITKRAKDSNDKYQNVWSNITKEIKRDETLNMFRFAINRGPNNESMGGEMFLDPRMEINLRSQFQEDIDNYITLEDGTKVNAFDYIADEIRRESVDGLETTFKTPTDLPFKTKRKSALNTVKGISISAEYINKPEALPNSNIILDIKLDDIKLSAPGSSASELVKTSIYKIIDNKGPQYSDLLKEVAKRENKNLDDIVALRINLGEGVTFDTFGKEASKKANQLIVPLYDLTPFKGEVQFDERIRDLNKVINAAKNYGTENGLVKSREILNDAVRQLYVTLAHDLNYEDKTSYISSKILKVPMKNSGMLHADSTIVPTVNTIVDNYNEWLNNADMRSEIIQAIKQGDINYDIDIASLTGRKYTTIRDKKRYYDDIVEMGKDAFIEKGVNFKETGKDLFFNKKDFKSNIKEMNTSFFDKKYAEEIINRGIETNEILKAMQSQYEYDDLVYRLTNRAAKNDYIDQIRNEISLKEYNKEFSILGTDEAKEIKALARNKFKKIQSEMTILNKGFEEIAEEYLTEIGTMGLAGRYPTFFKDSIGPVIFRLNKDLQRDEMVVSGVFGHKIHMDHDGDKGIVKLMIDSKGVVINKGNNKFLYNALSKAYELRVFSLKNNEILADELIKEKAVDKISDLVHGNVHLKREMLEKEMRLDTRNHLLTELKLDNLIGKDISDYTDEEVLKAFKGWDAKYGNMIRNTENLAASIKARITKGQIGTVSNANYAVNQVLYESLNQAIQQNDKSAINKYKEIITDLHLGNIGLLPLTEQKGIDVKHSYQGFTISEARKYNRGINELFKGNYDLGQQLIKESMADKFKDDKDWPKYLKSITTLAKDERAQRNFKTFKVSKNIDSIDNALKFMESALNYKEYMEKNNLTANTAVKGVLDALYDVHDSFTMGYYHNDVLQSIYEDAVFISTKDGSPVLYRVHGNVKSKNKKHTIKFDTFNLNKGSIVNGVPEWTSDNERIVGTATEVQAELQRKFGDFRGYSLAEITSDIKKFKTQINKSIVDVNINKYANLYARGNIKEASKLLDSLMANATSKKSVEAISVQKIEDYLSLVGNDNPFIDFINKAKYIKNRPKLQKKGTFDKNPNIINDMLTDINKKIIELGSNKNTSTSNIFDEALLQLTDDISKFGTDDYKNFVTEEEKAIKNIFKDYNKNIIDIQKAKRDLSDYDELKDDVNTILETYKKQNREYINSLKINPVTTYEMDEIFNWNSDDYKNMRVGINTESGLYGRRLADLSEADIKEILNFKNRGTDELSQYAYDTTKTKVLEFKENYEISKTSSLQGAKTSDIELLNNKLKEKASEAIEEGMNAQGKEKSKAKVKDLMKKTLTMDNAKKFISSTPGKVVMGLAALGLVSNLLSSGDNNSPLAPELNHKESIGPINNDSLKTQAPSSINTGKKTVYVDPSSGVQFKMSAKSKNKVGQMNTARQLAAQTGGDTNVNIYDDRSQISDNWLERKFSELV